MTNRTEKLTQIYYKIQSLTTLKSLLKKCNVFEHDISDGIQIINGVPTPVPSGDRVIQGHGPTVGNRLSKVGKVRNLELWKMLLNGLFLHFRAERRAAHIVRSLSETGVFSFQELKKTSSQALAINRLSATFSFQNERRRLIEKEIFKAIGSTPSKRIL